MKFLHTLISNGAIPLITKATRVTDRSSTIIDHIIINDTKHRIKPGVLEICNVSDHYPIFCQTDKPTLAPSFKKSEEPAHFFHDKSKFCPKEFNFVLKLALNNFFENVPKITTQSFSSIFYQFAKILKILLITHSTKKVLLTLKKIKAQAMDY